MAQIAEAATNGSESDRRTVRESPEEEDEEAQKDAAAEAERDRSDANYSEFEGTQINMNSLDDLVLPADVIRSAQTAWSTFLSAAGSKVAAGEAVYSALFEGSPSLQTLFVTPRAVQAIRFMSGIDGLIAALHDPPRLKVLVETLGFGHLSLDVTMPRVVIFRDALMDLLDVELAEQFTPASRRGWKLLLNYVGGAIMFVKAHYAERLRTLSDSWATVNKRTEKDYSDSQDGDGHSETSEDRIVARADKVVAAHRRQERTWRSMGGRIKDKIFRTHGDRSATKANGSNQGAQNVSENQNAKASDKMHNQTIGTQNVPTTYREMFMFNSAVMGFGASTWMNEVLSCFDNILLNVSNSARLQDECNVLVLRISNFTKGTSQAVNLAEYKSCMLASLRSLLPKAWDSAHEVAWSWLWDNVQRLLKQIMGKPGIWEKAVTKLMASFDETQMYELRGEIYSRFFVAAPAGQEYFKQSNTYLHVICDRILEMITAMYQDPVKMCDDISALGLRHVGYGIPTELFGPFVTACIEVMSDRTSDETAVDAFRFSLGLISNMLVRTIQEGSTIVMKAIEANSAKALRKAVSCAPRAQRAKWLLVVEVGTQSISPLSWAMSSGCIEAVTAIIEDLLTIRADRERYYYGVDELFGHHPDIVKRLIESAPVALTTLWDNLVWRCRTSENRMRRVNYYIKHLVVDSSGDPSCTLLWLTQYGNPKTMTHPIIVYISDLLWHKVCLRRFAARKAWYVLSLAVFMLSQVLLTKMEAAETDSFRYSIFGMRCINYGFIMIRLIIMHVPRVVRAYRHKDTVKVFGYVPAPEYLHDAYDFASFSLMLLLMAMAATEPMFWCMAMEEPGDPKFPTEFCQKADDVMDYYSVFCFAAMMIQWMLISDMVVFSTQLSAFMKVVRHVLGELGRFMIALGFLLLTFGSAISVLEHDQQDLQTIMQAAIALYAITVKLYQDDYRGVEEPALILTVFCYQTAVTILLLNLLIAQLQCSFEFINADAIGYARLNRSTVIADSVSQIKKSQWAKFVSSCNFDSRLEFNEGDIGISGGMQIFESNRLHTVVGEDILRFGGSTSESQPWPEETTHVDSENKFDRLERLLQKAIRRMVISDPSGSHGHGSSKERSGTSAEERGSKSSGSGTSGSGGSVML